LNRFILPKEPEGYKGAVCKTVGFSKGHSEDPGVAPLPNLAVYENQGGAAARRRGGASRAALSLDRPGKLPKTAGGLAKSVKEPAQ